MLVLFIEIAIIAHDARRREQFCNNLFMHVRILPEIDRGKMEPENLDGPPQRPQAAFDQRRALVRDERGLHDGQIGQQFFRGFIRLRRPLSAPGRRFAGQLLERHREPGIHADQRAAIRFILTMGVVDARSIGQCVYLRRETDEARRHRQFDPKLVELMQIVPHRHLALTAQGAHKGIHIHIRVAVPVAANPGAHLKEPRHSHAQPFFKVRIKMRDLSQEARMIEPERILDFVRDGEMREPQKPRLPELDDPEPASGTRCA